MKYLGYGFACFGFFLVVVVVVCFYIVLNMCHTLQSFIHSLIHIFRNAVLIEY